MCGLLLIGMIIFILMRLLLIILVILVNIEVDVIISGLFFFCVIRLMFMKSLINKGVICFMVVIFVV